MKPLVNRFVVIALILFALSCSKEESLEGGSLTPSIGESQWVFLDSTGIVKGTVDTAFIANVGNLESAVFVGPSEDATGVIYLQIVGTTIAPGTYTTDNVLFEYYIDGSLLYKNVPVTDGAFTVVVTSVDSAGYSGTFSGEVYDNNGVIRTIRDGKFKAKVSADSAPTAGQLTVWSKELCTPSGDVEIIIANQKASITQTFTTAPTNCGVTGAANFTLPAGSHPVQIICGTDTTNESVDIVAGQCLIAELQ